MTVISKSVDYSNRLLGFITLFLVFTTYVSLGKLLTISVLPFCFVFFLYFICKRKTMLVGHRREESKLGGGKKCVFW